MCYIIPLSIQVIKISKTIFVSTSSATIFSPSKSSSSASSISVASLSPPCVWDCSSHVHQTCIKDVVSSIHMPQCPTLTMNHITQVREYRSASRTEHQSRLAGLLLSTALPADEPAERAGTGTLMLEAGLCLWEFFLLGDKCEMAMNAKSSSVCCIHCGPTAALVAMISSMSYCFICTFHSNSSHQ